MDLVSSLSLIVNYFTLEFKFSFNIRSLMPANEERRQTIVSPYLEPQILLFCKISKRRQSKYKNRNQEMRFNVPASNLFLYSCGKVEVEIN